MSLRYRQIGKARRRLRFRLLGLVGPERAQMRSQAFEAYRAELAARGLVDTNPPKEVT